MRHNQKYTASELQLEARRVVETTGETQASVARKLEVSRNAIHRALNTDKPYSYASTLGRIIDALTDFEIQSSTFYQAKRKRRK